MKIKTLSRILAFGILLSSLPINSFASIMSEDDRYETFKDSNITISDVLEEYTSDIKIEGESLVNNCLNSTKDGVLIDRVVRFDPSMIRPNTEYTLIFEVPENNLIEGNKFIIELHSQYGSSKVYIYPKETGKFIRKVVTHDTVNLVPWIATSNGNTTTSGGSVILKNLMILEGDWTNRDIPEYFEGVKSSFEDQLVTQEMVDLGKEKAENLGKYKVEYKSTGKNKFDGIWEYGNIYSNNGGEDSNTNTIKSKNYISILPNNNYTVSSDTFLNGVVWIFYDKNFKFISGTDLLSSCVSPSNARYLKIRTHSSDSNILSLDAKLQLEEGLISTQYEPFKESTNTFYLNSPLLEGDTIEYINGQATHAHRYEKIILNGNEDWKLRTSLMVSEDYPLFTWNVSNLNINTNERILICDKINTLDDIYTEHMKECEYIGVLTPGGTPSLSIKILSSKLSTQDVDGFKLWLQKNPTTVVYQLLKPRYEPIKADLSVNLFKETTHISNNSNIPATMEVTVDRVANRAKEYSELAKTNPTMENIALARMWVNRMRESILKDEFQDNIGSITKITDMTLERKTTSASVDVYIKSENLLSMSLNTNSITFEDFSGVDDVEKPNTVNISINSSLPYNLNAYLSTEIQNSDKSKIMDKDILNIKENSEANYQTFNSVDNKVVLKSNCESGNNKQHNIDFKLKGGIAHEKDVYKTTIKFEAEQK